jgi:hypothetical protein
MLASGRTVGSFCGPILALVVVLGGFPLAGWGQPIIIDHRTTQIEKVPAYWLEQAKLLTFHYAHTSHGSQIVSGLGVLESQHAIYSVAIRESGTEGLPPVESPPALRIYDGNPPETYIEPDDYWDGTSGMNRTRAVAATGRYRFSMWSWCGQQSSNSAATTQAYLNALNQLESEYPAMRFIYMTGHTDGSGESGNLNQRNNQVRQYCLANNKVLFDFADIESYDPDGNYYLNLYCNDNCDYSGGNWAAEWCAAHPGNELCASCSCAHSQSLNCNVKARAFWWMMARLAGWNGITVGDADHDGDVDQGDFTLFADCFAGPNTTPAPTLTDLATCREAFDADEDLDVDAADFHEFQAAFTGP